MGDGVVLSFKLNVARFLAGLGESVLPMRKKSLLSSRFEQSEKSSMVEVSCLFK